MIKSKLNPIRLCFCAGCLVVLGGCQQEQVTRQISINDSHTKIMQHISSYDVDERSGKIKNILIRLNDKQSIWLLAGPDGEPQLISIQEDAGTRRSLEFGDGDSVTYSALQRGDGFVYKMNDQQANCVIYRQKRISGGHSSQRKVASCTESDHKTP